MTIWTIQADGNNVSLSLPFRIAASKPGYFNNYVRTWTMTVGDGGLRCERSIFGPDQTKLRPTLPDDSVRRFPIETLQWSGGAKEIADNIGVPEQTVAEGLKILRAKSQPVPRAA